MNIQKCFFLLIILTGCAKPPQAKPPVYVDPILVGYFQEFESKVGASTAGVSGYFADLPYPTLGECESFTDGTRNVLIDKSYWDSVSDDSKEELVLHELGHCALNLQHINTLNSYGCPNSIMYMYEFGESPCYEFNKSYYYEELESHK